MHNDGLALDGVAKIPEKVFESRKNSHIEPGDILLNITGASIGRCAIVPTPFQDADINQHVLILRQVDQSLSEYAHLAITSPLVQDAIMTVQVGATKEGLSATKASRLLIAFPPREEQVRILEATKKAFEQVNQYGTLEDERERLDAELPDRLRKSILQMAVQGKLVLQDPNDEPASVLLERIREERTKLIGEKKLKAPKGGESVIYRGSDGGYYEKRIDAKGRESEPVCIDDEIPFEIPDSWEWSRLGSLLQLVSDGTHKTPDYKESGVKFLSVQNISSGVFDLRKTKYISKEDHEQLCKRVRPQNGDILICRIGTLGKPIIVDVDYEFSIFVSLGLLRAVDSCVNQWIVRCIDSPIGSDWIQDVKVGGGTHTFKINLGDIPTFLMPVPPLEEQARIVAALDSAICALTNQR